MKAASRRAFRLVMVAATLLSLGLVAELALRAQAGSGKGSAGSGEVAGMLPVAQQLKMQEEAIRVTYAADPDLGALLAPDRRDVMDTPEFSYTLATDHAGFTNRDPWPDKVAVAVLGDSLLTGPGVGFDGQFTTLLQQQLGGRSVLNFGLPGAGTGHQLQIYRKFLKSLHPGAVISVIWPTWDVDNSLQFERWHAEKSDMDFTQYRLTFGDTHSTGTNRQPSPISQYKRELRDFLSRSYLLRAIYLRIKTSQMDPGPVERANLPDGGKALLAVRDELRLAKGLERPGAPDIEEVFFAPLMNLKSEVEADGGRFVVVLVPCKEELYAAAAFPEVLRLREQLQVGFAARQLPVLDLYPLFRKLARDRAPFFRVDPHLSPTGNRVVAEALANWFADGTEVP